MLINSRSVTRTDKNITCYVLKVLHVTETDAEAKESPSAIMTYKNDLCKNGENIDVPLYSC